jgi:hypothetical protein
MDIVSSISEKGVAIYLSLGSEPPVSCRISGRSIFLTREDGVEETWRVGERTRRELLNRRSVSVFELDGSNPVRVRVLDVETISSV